MRVSDITWLMPKHKKLLAAAKITSITYKVFEPLKMFMKTGEVLTKKYEDRWQDDSPELDWTPEVKVILDLLKIGYHNNTYYGELSIKSRRSTMGIRKLMEQERVEKLHEERKVHSDAREAITAAAKEAITAAAKEAETLEIDVHFINALADLETRESTLNFTLRDRREARKAAMKSLLKANNKTSITSDFNLLFDEMIKKAKSNWLWEIHLGTNNNSNF